MLVPVLLFILGLLLLIKGGDWFVDGAAGLAHRFRLPELLIGATVVSIGTTLPEVMVSAQAALQGNAGISYGNALGSIICNTSLIAAITIAIKPGNVNKKALRLPVAAFFLAAILYLFFAYTQGRFPRLAGLIFLGFFVAYMLLNVWQMKKDPIPAEGDEKDGKDTAEAPSGENSSFTARFAAFKASLPGELVLLLIGAGAIAFGANLLVNNGTLIAKALGVPDSVIGLTMVALGTSLPELVTAITSLAKGHGSLSLGNVIGANLFNIVLVSGTAITISPFALPSEKILAGHNASLIVDIPVMLLVMLLLTLPPLLKGKLSRWQGIVLLLLYVGFTVFQFIS